MRSLLLIAAVGLLFVSCQSSGSTGALADWDTFGEAVSAAEPITVEALLADPDAYADKTVVVEAPVEAVCQKKGCWMTFQSGDDSVRITFKDYGFFVPMDIPGRTVRVEGVFSIREVPVDEARHYLEDEGRMDEALAIVEPQRTYEIVAVGVAAHPLG